MRVCGLDPGSVRLGYAVIKAEGQLLSYVECGVLTARAGAGKYERLAELAADLERLLSEMKPDVVAMEAGFVGMVKGKHQQGVLVSAAARGVAGMLAARAGIPVVEYAPSTVKLRATGKGNADKTLVAKMVMRRLFLQREPAPDAADALAIAICHADEMVFERRAAARAAG